MKHFEKNITHILEKNPGVYFNRPNNLEDLLRQRIRSEMEQINPDIIERRVQKWLAISTFSLRFIVNLKCFFVFI
jgi:hypothetical protein